jgi:FPC/CPF motif-containing protein YcgG
LAATLTHFATAQSPDALYVSFIVLFSDTDALSEEDFEKYLWQRLQGIHDADPHAWDPAVSDDPSSAEFSMSIGGHAFYIVGLHPGSSRLARRANVPALVFNLHAQFEALRANGQYERMRNIIRQRDIDLCGSVNPMLAGFGESPEARQYSGRKVDAGWVCPFHKRSS